MATYKTVRLISEAFDRHNIVYQVYETEEYQEIQAPFSIDVGPLVTVHFNSKDRGNDLEIRLPGLVNNIPAEKRPSMLEVCNTLNEKYRFTKFSINKDGNVNVKYDLPVTTGDESVGEMCFDIFVILIQILNQGYPLIAEALYRENAACVPEGNADGLGSLQHMLKDDQDEINIKISRMPSSDTDHGTFGEENSDTII